MFSNRQDDLLLAGLASLAGASGRPERPGTRAVQNWINSFAAEMGVPRISEDAVWGCETTTALGRLLVWLAARTGMLTAGSTLVAGLAAATLMERANMAGPLPYALLMRSVDGHPQITAAQVGEAHAGWSDWVVAGRPCGEGRTAGTVEMQKPPVDDAGGDGGDGDTPPPPPPPPSNTLRYVGWAAAGVGAALFGWWVWRRRR